MSKRFLTPINLPSGSNLPSVGRIGDLFFKTTDGAVYAYTAAGWVSYAARTTLGSLDDVSAVNLSEGDTLLYNPASLSWEALQFKDAVVAVLLESGTISMDGGSYNTTTFAGTIDGGSHNTTSFTAIYDGGSAGSI
jgi:hypothetical protein